MKQKRQRENDICEQTSKEIYTTINCIYIKKSFADKFTS